MSNQSSNLTSQRMVTESRFMTLLIRTQKIYTHFVVDLIAILCLQEKLIQILGRLQVLQVLYYIQNTVPEMELWNGNGYKMIFQLSNQRCVQCTISANNANPSQCLVS